MGIPDYKDRELLETEIAALEVLCLDVTERF